MAIRPPPVLLGGYALSALAVLAGLWRLDGEDEWGALGLCALGAVLLAMVATAVRALDSGEG